jgi:iron complex outermembrane receptor protein
MKLTPVLPLMLFLLPRPAAAQDTPARRDTVVLPAIVVTAPRLALPLTEDPAAAKVVGAEQLDLPRGIAVDEAMMLVPGVRVENQADGKRVHLEMRGQGILAETGIRGIGILLDGLPLNDPTGFAPDLYDIDWPTVSQVEVQRGPAGSLYGGGSSAGIINVTTADGGLSPARGDLSSTYGSNGFWRGSAELGGTLGDVNYRMSYTHNTGDGYRVHTAFNGDNLYAKAHWSPSPSLHLTPILGYTTYFNQNAEGLNLTWLAQDRRMANPDALTYNEYQDTKRVVGGIVGQWDLGGAQSISGDVFLRHTAWRVSVPSSVDHRSMDSPGATLQYTVERATGALRHHVSVGTDVKWQTIDDYTHPNLGGAVEGDTLLSDQTFSQSGAGVFALDRIDLSRQWGVMLNVRYDYIGNKLTDHLKSGGVDLSGNANFWAWTVRGGLTWNPTPALSFYGNVGQGFLPPATEELAANPDHIGGFNESLKAATSLGEEVGARGAVGTVVFDIGAFHLNTANDFDRYRVASRPLETFYRNAGSSRRFGVETSAAWAPVSPLLVQVAYTWSDFKYTNSQSAYGDVLGHWLPNSPEHRVVADGAYTIGPATLGVTSETVSRWYVDPSNVASVAGYTLLHARIAWRVVLSGTRMAITAEVRNIFAVQYMGYTEPDPDGNSYQPAAEREMFVGISLGK